MDLLARQRSVAGAALSCLALAASALLPAPARAAGAPGATHVGGFSARPAQYSATDPATRSYFKLTLAPGQTVTRDVLAGADSTAPVTLDVYPADGLTGVTSGAVYSGEGVALHAAGRWLSLGVPSVTLGPQSRQRLPFTIHVPSDATPGVHLAGIALQAVNATRVHRGAFHIIQLFRVVVGVEITVPGPASRDVAVTRARIAAPVGTEVPSVRLTIANRGGLLCSPHVTVHLRRGAWTQTEARQLDVVLPGDEIPYPFTWRDALAAGRYHVAVRATGCGAPAALHAVVFNGRRIGPRPTGAHASRAAIGGDWPVWLLAAVAAAFLVLGVAGGRLLARRR